MKVFVLFFCLWLTFGSEPLLCSTGNLPKQAFPNELLITETGERLTLQGIATHKVFFEDSYLGAFYSRERVKNGQEALESKGSKRMWFYFLRPSNSLKADWKQAISDNNSRAMVDRDQININQFLKIIDTSMNEGDSLILDFIPNLGTKITENGAVKGIIKGNEFYNLLLKTWMGRQPPSDKFKNDLFHANISNN